MALTETDTLAGLIRAKRECLQQLRDMARRQIELIDLGDMTSLLDVLAVKQRSLTQLQRIENALNPFREQDPKQRQWRDAETRARCAEDVQQCETLLREILGQEKLGENALVRRRDQAAEQLKGAHFAGQARGAYDTSRGAQAGPIHTGQLDLQSDA